MIVKNEAHVIERCLRSVRALVDYVLVEDTGSTDGTRDIIRAFLLAEDLPGEVFDEPWQDFATNRTLALERLRRRQHIDYALVIDADDVAVTAPGFDPDAFRRSLTADQYSVELRHGGTLYWCPQLLSNHKPFSYRGVLHEFIETPPRCTTKTTSSFHILSGREGDRSRNPNKYRDDALLLERVLYTEQDPFLISRYTFYLGQSWRDAGEAHKAIAAYLDRADQGFWAEERYLSLLNVARLKEQLGHPDDEVIEAYEKAHAICPHRAEALHGATKLCRIKGRNRQGYEIGRRGLSLVIPDGLFIERWVYDFGLHDEFAVNAYWAAHYAECVAVCLRLLEGELLFQHDRLRIAANARSAAEQIEKQPDRLDVRLLRDRTGSPELTLPAPAVLRPRIVPGLVSIVTPTFNRSSFLRQALTYVLHQDYADIEWLVLDDSSPEHDSCEDMSARNIFYQRITEKLSIGEKRNRLIERAKGEVIINFDDDDYYAPNYVTTMLSALTTSDADLINLRGWFLYDLRSRFFGYWDLENKEGPHYRCDRDGVSLTMLTPRNNGEFANNHLGYGFSYAFKKRVWDAVRFSNIDWNEDGDFSLRAAAMFKVDGMHDTTGVCLHFLHSHSTARCFPQHHLPGFTLRRLFPNCDNLVANANPAGRNNGRYLSRAGPAVPGMAAERSRC